MNSFEFQFATKMIFGKDKESCVGEEIKTSEVRGYYWFTEENPLKKADYMIR